MYSSPVRHSPPGYCYPALPFDLHVLGMPPAFNLSQDQTLHLKLQPGPKTQQTSEERPQAKNYCSYLERRSSMRPTHRIPGAHTSHLRTLS